VKLTPLTKEERTQGTYKFFQIVLDETVAQLGSEWKITTDYVSLHPFFRPQEGKKTLIDIYKDYQSARGIYLVGSPLFYYIDPLKDS